MTAVKIDDRLTVASQPSRETLSALAAGGFATIINNRPDGEGEDQPSSAEIQTAALASGLEYFFLPVTAGQISDQQVAAFTELLGHVLLVHCQIRIWPVCRDSPTPEG